MYTPEIYRIEDQEEIRAMIRACGLATLVTVSSQGMIGTPVPLFLAAEEEEQGVLYGHIARANPQWQDCTEPEALVIFSGADAYVTPAWYPAKNETGRVVPTWNYLAVHAYGPVEFFEDPARLLDVVSRLTDFHEGGNQVPWSVKDAPQDFIAGQLRAIVGVRIPIHRLDAKKKVNQRNTPVDRAGVRTGLQSRGLPGDLEIAGKIPH